MLKGLFANQQRFPAAVKKLNWVGRSLRGRYHSPFGSSGCCLLHQNFAVIQLSPWDHISSDLVLLSVLVELGVQQENKADTIFHFIY